MAASSPPSAFKDTIVKLCRPFAVFACVIPVATIIICVIITRSMNIDIGGISYPYISDTGRDSPSYPVFVAGMSVTSFFMIWTLFANFKMLLNFSVRYGHGLGFRIAAGIALCFGLISSVTGPLLAGLTTRKYPDGHLYSAYAFFFALIIYVIMNSAMMTSVFRRNSYEESRRTLRTSLALKWTCCGCMIVTFVIYIPIGISILCAWQYNSSTGLYDYTNCPSTHVMRTITQHLTVLFLVAYFATFAVDFTPENLLSTSSASGKQEEK